MTGPKLNEANRIAGSSSGAKAQLRWVRMSASKFRPVLNQVRGLDVTSASEVLSLHSVEAARIVQKLLKSAVANATNNLSLDEETLYVKACFADESPTIKRFRPRARGRANTRLRRGAHVTIVVDAFSPDELKIREASDASGGRSEKAQRRQRVAASKARAAAEQASDAKNASADESAGAATNDGAETPSTEESK
ncbi:MAG: ribosomal protein [Actinomycetota bacterium]|nr:50S ribosomal protein L22 [Ilumatobacteraceae bacterium]